MIFISMLFFLYFISLLLFCLFSHPVYYCGLLIINVLMCSLMTYMIFGFGWYPLLLCLVYMGGVYILFVFMSVYSPNSKYKMYFNFSFSSMLLLMMIILAGGGCLIWEVLNMEFSAVLCTNAEGLFYMVLCLTLLFSFLVLSLIMSMKINYYR